MAKKKKKKGKSSSKKMGINTSKLLGMGGAVFAERKFIDGLLGKYIKDPKMKAVALMAIGECGPKQDMVKNLLKDDAILNGAGDALTVIGIQQLLTSMGIAGMGAQDTDELAVVIEGIDDVDMDEDVLGEDDLNVVNEDVLGEDDLNVVNEDVLGDDDDY
jgi:hypothetical protein